MEDNKENGLLKLIKERVQKEKNRPKETDPIIKRNNVKKWCTFYRRNINLYASRHLKIKLHPFQHIMLYLMGVSQVFFAICSRGLSKSFIVALYAICKCLLFPYSEVHLTATTINQAKKMVKNKMEDELCCKLSPILKYYYDIGLIKFHYGKDEIRVDFLMNQSHIWVDPADEQSRGGRATLLIYEECRLLKKGIIDSVFEKMAHPRQAMFMNLPQYAGDKRWIEECQSVYITSARFKSEWFWNTFKTVVQECFANKKIPYNFFAGDIFLSMCFGLKTVSDYFKSKKQSGELDFRMEDLNEMVGEAENAFFSHELMRKNQVYRKAYRFPTINDIYEGKDLKNRKKQDDEIRLLWIDFAFANTTGAEENDQSVIGCTSLVKKDGKYRRICDYITTHPASDSDGIDLKIREMFWDYKADYIVFDCRNGGEVVYTDLTKPRKHPQRAESDWNEHGFTIAIENAYQTSTTAKLDDLRARTIDPQAIPCLIPMIGTTELNSNMWLDLQKKLRDGEIDLLIEDIEFEQKFEETKEYFTLTDEEKTSIRLPYVMTMALINEAINLSQEWREGKVKLTEPRSGTKDIIVSFAYGNYVSSLIINKLEQTENDEDEVNLDDWQWLRG